jgi:hypothetical protein
MRLGRVVSRILRAVLLTLPFVGCSEFRSDSPILSAEMPLHLEEHLDAATVVAAEVPVDIPAAIEWAFDQRQPDWLSLDHYNPSIPPPNVEYVEDALRVSLDGSHQDPRENRLHGDIYVELPELRRGDWSHVTTRPFHALGLDSYALGDLGDTSDLVLGLLQNIIVTGPFVEVREHGPGLGRHVRRLVVFAHERANRIERLEPEDGDELNLRITLLTEDVSSQIPCDAAARDSRKNLGAE